MTTGEKKAALLLAFGGIEKTDDIEPFLKNILRGRPVSSVMLARTRERYEKIGGRSPLLDITRAQAAAVEKKLAEKGAAQKVYVGMRYWHPYIKDTIEEIIGDGVTRVTAAVMTPFTSPVATGGYEDDMAQIQSAGGSDIRVDFIGNWHLAPLLLEAVVDNIKVAVGDADPADLLVIYSSHSLPREALEGDAYEMKINQTVAVLNKMFPADHRISYQSQGTSTISWLGPSTDDMIEEAKKLGKKGVVIVPLGFVADHVETLYDIDIMYRNFAESLGLVFKRSASLNTSPKFIELLAQEIKNLSERF
ncbi:MAG: ferrochelatase [Thermodesulfobacteriota bacterium]